MSGALALLIPGILLGNLLLIAAGGILLVAIIVTIAAAVVQTPTRDDDFELDDLVGDASRDESHTRAD